MSRHTPGPWYWDFYRDGLASLRSDHGDEGPVMIDVDCYPDVADRCLIAAAPEMLAVLIRVADLDDSDFYGKIVAVRKAIAHAQGEE